MSRIDAPLNNNSANFDRDTRLCDTGLRFTDVVLTERFLLPPESLRRIGERVPETLGEIAEMSGIPLAEVLAVIEECFELSADLYLPPGDLAEYTGVEGTVLVDMRPDVTIESEPLHPDARMFHLQSPATMLPYLRSCQKVIVLSAPDSHAWSAAMALRKMKIPAVLTANGEV
jgi:hypothetical protein